MNERSLLAVFAIISVYGNLAGWVPEWIMAMLVAVYLAEVLASLQIDLERKS